MPESNDIKSYSGPKEYRQRQDSLLSEWACNYKEEARPWPKRERYDSRLGYRTEFQMDRDDILYSSSFRQLAYKRQMFSSRDVESFYTRLTHTLIVSQISRSIARGLQLDEHLAEAIALGHDLGHTPYGHSGEVGIDRFLKRNLFPLINKQLEPDDISHMTIEERIEKENELHSNPERNREFDQYPLFEMKTPVSLKELEEYFLVLPSDSTLFNHHRQSYRYIRFLERQFMGLEATLFTYYGILRCSGSIRDDDGFDFPALLLSTDFASFETQVVRLADDIAWANHDLTEDCRKTGKNAEKLLLDYQNKYGADLEVHHDDMRAFLHTGPGERYGIFITDAINNNKDMLSPRGFLGKESHGSGYVIGLSKEINRYLNDMKRIVIGTIHRTPEMESISARSTKEIEEICGHLLDNERFEAFVPLELLRGKRLDDLSRIEKLRIIADAVAFMTDSEADEFYNSNLSAHRSPPVEGVERSRLNWLPS